MKSTIKRLTLIAFFSCLLIGFWGYHAGLFTSQDTLKAFLDKYGKACMALFILFQIVQVVIPILPGGISCLAGVLLFGTLKGFFYNYVGICLGSLLVFGIARNYGKPLMGTLFPKRLIDKYTSWTENSERFFKMFAIAIFLPLAPDDILCYLAGTTSMSWKRFSAVIFLGKPFAIAAYSLGLYMISRHIFPKIV
jgi:uncharacterized membrane protein YdjX (TVP38/TMEM64 family)